MKTNDKIHTIQTMIRSMIPKGWGYNVMILDPITKHATSFTSHGACRKTFTMDTLRKSADEIEKEIQSEAESIQPSQ